MLITSKMQCSYFGLPFFLKRASWNQYCILFSAIFALGPDIINSLVKLIFQMSKSVMNLDNPYSPIFYFISSLVFKSEIRNGLSWIQWQAKQACGFTQQS